MSRINNEIEMEIENASEAEIDDIDEDDGRAGTPDELVQAASEASEELLPFKSKDRYMNVYNEYIKWKKVKKTSSDSERVVLAYLNSMAKSGKAPTTLWARYSMLKATLKIFGKVNIETYPSVTALLKRKSHGHVVKKAKVFTEEEVKQFFDTAPDVAWLDVKAALAFGICGCCRSHELPVIRMQDIHRYDDMYYVIISADDTKTKKKNNEFAITGTFLDVVRRYEQLRPSHATTDRFFLNYQNGKCTSQTIGKNKFYKMPHRVAAFMQLPDVTLYTGHSIRRTSTTIFANTGASIEALKRHTGHISSTVCESYIEESKGHKKKIANTIMSSIKCAPTSTATSSIGQSVFSDETYRDCTPLVDIGSVSAGHSFDVDPLHRPVDPFHRPVDSFGDMSTSSVRRSVGVDELHRDRFPLVEIGSSSVRNSVDVDALQLHRPVDPFGDMSTNSVCRSMGVDGLHHDISLLNVGSSSGGHSMNVDPFGDISTSSARHLTCVDKSQRDDNDMVSDSENINPSQISSRSFNAQMDKKFAFYKCSSFTINFQPTFHKKNN